MFVMGKLGVIVTSMTLMIVTYFLIGIEGNIMGNLEPIIDSFALLYPTRFEW